jgi:Protein of unknown function (DUF3619)
MTSNSQLRNAAETRFGRDVARLLTEGNQALPHDISERLRVSRMQAMASFKQQQRPQAIAIPERARAPALVMADNGEDLSWWNRVAAAIPALLLVLGLFGISEVHDVNRAQEIAAIDVALLTDALPPEAYTDPGFLRFVKLQQDSLIEGPGIQ